MQLPCQGHCSHTSSWLRIHVHIFIVVQIVNRLNAPERILNFPSIIPKPSPTTFLYLQDSPNAFSVNNAMHSAWLIPSPLYSSSNSLVSVRIITTYPLLQWVPFAVRHSVSPLRPYKMIPQSVFMVRPKIYVWFAWYVNCFDTKRRTRTTSWVDNKSFSVMSTLTWAPILDH